MSQALLGINPARTTTEAQFALLQNGMDEDGNEYLYVQANGALDAQDCVVIDEAGQAVVANLTNTASAFGDRVGVVNAAFADNEHGWAQVSGVTTVNVLTLAAANAQLNSTATDGTLDDDATVGSEDIAGLVLTTARGAGTGPAACMLNYPTVGATN